MRSCLYLRTLYRLGFPLCGWLALMLFVLIASGVPIPVPYAKDLSQPFPCMFGQCGCRSAEQCWRNCCCHTPEQRLAWAAAHRVATPAFLKEQAAASKALGCCATAKVPACCQDSNPSEPQSAASCCSQDGSVSISAALKCAGSGEFLAGVSLCLPPPRVDWKPTIDRLNALGVVSLWPTSPDDAPSAPPPRAADC